MKPHQDRNRVITRLARWLHRVDLLWSKLRVLRWRLTPGVSVGRNVYLGRGASVRFNCDGFMQSGTVRLGDRVRIGEGVILMPYGGSIDVDVDAYIGPFSLLYGHGGLRIGQRSLVAANCIVIPANHRFDDLSVPIASQGETRFGITIGPDVWIGCGCRILDGVDLGQGCIVAAGSVVTKSAAPLAIIAGVPAVMKRSRLNAGTQPPQPHAAVTSERQGDVADGQ